MLTSSKTRAFPGANRVFPALLCCVGLAAFYGQNKLPQPQAAPPEKSNEVTLREAIDNVESGFVNTVYINRLGPAGKAEVIPNLEKQFALSQDKTNKAKIASVLVRLGDKDNAYWDFLVAQVTPVLENKDPFPMTFDSAGKEIPSPAFVDWVKSHNLDINTEAQKAMFELPAPIFLLGVTRDRRAIPLLRRALLSPNYMVEIVAASGLAQIRDDASIPEILEMCRKASADLARAFASFSLVCFDDPRAQSAVDQYLSKEDAKAVREAQKGNGICD